MAYCVHDHRERRPLRIVGYDQPQLVCEVCWRRAVRLGHVER